MYLTARVKHLLILTLATHVLSLSLLLARPVNSTQVIFDINFRDWCTQRCPYQNQTEEGNFDVGCGSDCKIEQCSRGCELWHRALESSCQTVCNGTQDLLTPKELYCIIGCNDAVNRYFQRLKDEIGVPAAPALVADTLTATSLSLEWEGSRYSNISYLVQWRYEELAGAWHYCRTQTWGPHATVFVDNLQPYTKYRFRIALLLSPHHSEPIVSQPSVVISTLGSGVPSSPPTIVRATADIAASENKDHYMFKNLLAERNYTLSVAMRNSVGEGPASTILVSTPAEPTVRDAQQQPVLILGAHHTVIRQVTDMMEDPVVMYNTTQEIKGVAIHVSRHMLFVSDSAGYVHRTSLYRYQSPRTILTPLHASFLPLDLAVDWLNDQLYMLGEVKHSSGPRWQVARCGLDGRGLTIAVAGLFSKPHHIEVDPYNGYLFWVVSGPRGGLYRLDMADISNGIKHDIQPELIFEDPNLGAFTVDHTNFRLLVPHDNTILAVSLDGHERLDLRHNTQKPQFHDVTSIAYANGLFYWTNGREIYTEEYHPGQDSYFHNGYPDLSNRSFVTVNVNLPSSQPMPIPVNPPTNVQAILGAELAKTSWQVPHLLGGQGKGAWQNWSYELHIKDETRGITIFSKGINATSYTIQNLMENTEYVIKTAAYTSSGKGPWSSEFRGKTLRFPRDGQYASILWSATEGLLKSDVTGENVETLIHNSNLKDNSEDYHITDIAWYQDRLYLVTNTTHVDWFNTTSHERGTLTEIDSVGSIAVDWIGKKLYWSNPKQQLITRGNLNGTQQEPLPILTVAKELNIDAVQAYIYWSTGHAVECARLNGEERRTYYPADMFSGKQVMGLTLDVDQRAVYWIVRSYEGSKLFQAPMADRVKPNQEIELLGVTSLQQPDMQGPLCYFSDHLLWLKDNRSAVIGDLNGQNAAVISGMSLYGLNMVAIMDPAIHQVINSSFLKEINVIPDSVSQQSISINGTHKSFKITWGPVTNVNYGQTFYEVKIDDFSKQDAQQRVTNETSINYWSPYSLTPYSPLRITIKAFTYWGVSAQVRATLHSPPSIPSIPINARVFVSYVRNPIRDGQEINAALRWDPPVRPNGIVKGYKVKCWFTISENDFTVCDSYDMNVEKREFTAYNLLRNSTYYFQVQAFTEVGSGLLTAPVRADTDVEMPVPQLLLSTFDAVKITDCDKLDNQTLSHGNGPPIDLAFISHENRIFWLNELRELLSSNVDGRRRTKIVTLNNTGLSIAVDWVGRQIYWSEVDGKDAGSTIYRLDLNQAEKGTIYAAKVLKRTKYIHSLQISPYKSKLFWIESNQNEVGYLMTGKTDGSHIKPFFTKNKSRQRRHNDATSECTCSENPPVGTAMTIDHTNLSHPKLLWVDGWAHHVYSADLSGCRCSLLVNATVTRDVGLPPTSITADQRLLYWSNATTGRVYSVSKAGEDTAMASMVEGITTRDISGVRGIAALGSHLQPYPEPRCLSPRQFPTAVSLFSRTSSSVTLQLPDAFRYGECENISLATVEYSVYYGPMRDDDNGTAGCISNLVDCAKLTTYEQRLEIAELKPFTRYVFFVGLKNYYSDMEGVEPMVGPPTVFPTDAGAPSSPRNVTVVAVNPNALLVQWQLPLEFNDDAVRYQVQWATDGTVAGVRQTGEQAVSDPNDQTFLSTRVNQLLPGRTYFISVRAYSVHNPIAYNESRVVPMETYPEPDAVVKVSSTASTLNVSWTLTEGIESQRIECRESGANEWHTEALEMNDDGEFGYALENLLPKTKYTFRLALVYKLSTEVYVWPQDERFTFETLGDRPSPPGTPVIQHVKRDVYQLNWEASRENGAHIETYSLDGLIVGGKRAKREDNYTSDEQNESTDDEEWIAYYNGSDNYWIIKELGANLKYKFRVRSRNSYGWSEFSQLSESFDVNEATMLAGQSDIGVWLATVIAVLFAITTIVTSVVSYYMCMFTRRKQDKKALQGTTMIRGPDTELATLRELPRRGNFVHNTNALYTTSDSLTPTDAEIALLPHIRRDQITLTKFLGSGAFGEVFEGTARSVTGNLGGAESRVAVKTLRKGATDQEKAEFLQEAQLMSNFKHEHILQLLGVCLDNDPNFIIMELMESGDLLSYLRISRPLIYSSNALTLLDLLAMCVDVARGCRYLEEMHFVHRDLACRNCLVSSDDPLTRTVKIGDFGLARDIYKNDYYRKEGEGLLPVRWMSPESLVDGVFTCQSDVWAFGVLIWEILTLGQQPYPARSNLEVLHYVRNGGRLGRPSNCPEELHQLMLKCWSYNPESRPTFKYCLDVLEGLKSKTTAVPLTAVHIGHYVSRTRNGSSWKTESDGGSRDRVPFLQTAPELLPRQPLPSSTPHILRGARNNSPMVQGEVPRYLELIYDSDSPTISDGYEIPRTNRARGEQGDDDRPRTFSTSSTLSDISASTSLSNPTSPVGRIEEVAEGDIKGGSRKNSTLEIRKTSEKDLSSLEQLLPTVKLNNNQTLSVNAVNDRNKKPVISYTNVANQPLLETAILNDSVSTENVSSTGLVSKVIESNAQNQTLP